MVIFFKRGQKKKGSVWDGDDMPAIMAPLEAPSTNVFSTNENVEQSSITPVEVLPLPAEGLPPGWTMEQWEHYGHQYQVTQDTVDGHNQK